MLCEVCGSLIEDCWCVEEYEYDDMGDMFQDILETGYEGDGI